MARPFKFASCHPERPHKARGMCSKCYDMTRNRGQFRKWYMVRRLYGLSESDYSDMLNRQGGACALCGNPSESLCVDHCHKTNKIRGLLCGECNIALGHYEKLRANPLVEEYLSPSNIVV